MVTVLKNSKDSNKGGVVCTHKFFFHSRKTIPILLLLVGG